MKSNKFYIALRIVQFFLIFLIGFLIFEFVKIRPFSFSQDWDQAGYKMFSSFDYFFSDSLYRVKRHPYIDRFDKLLKKNPSFEFYESIDWSKDMYDYFIYKEGKTFCFNDSAAANINITLRDNWNGKLDKFPIYITEFSDTYYYLVHTQKLVGNFYLAELLENLDDTDFRQILSIGCLNSKVLFGAPLPHPQPEKK